jgi:hypothetical protein
VSGTELRRELRERADALREELDGLRMELREARGTLFEALGEAGAHLSRFCELGLSDEGLEALGALRATTVRAREALPEEREELDGPLLDEALAWIDDLKRRALDALPPPGALLDRAASLEATKPFLASVGSPVVHQPFVVPAPALLEKRRDFLELPPDSEPPASGVRDKNLVELELSRLGRDAMEDIAILGGLRRSKDPQIWFDAHGFERRLLANLDALWSLDRPLRAGAPRLGVPMALFAYVSEWSFPDWGRAFALAFTLGCTDSDAALRWVVLALRRAELSVLDAYVEGLALASGPGIGRAALAELGADVAPRITAAWLAVAERKHAFEAGPVIPLLAHPDDEVRIAAARCLRHAPRALALEAWLELVRDASPRVAAEAADELAAVGHREGLAVSRLALAEALRAPEPSDPDAPLATPVTLALRALALAGEPGDEEALLAAAKRWPLAKSYLGWYGRAAHLDWLLGELEEARARGPQGFASAEACEAAITRISGLAAALPSPELRAAIAQHTEASRAYRSAKRVRLGAPHDPAAVVAELAATTTPQGARRVLARELCLVLPEAPRFDVDDWVARQQASLELLRTMLPSRGT